MKPVVAISLGDPAGISPEVVARCLGQGLGTCHPVVFGHWASLEQALVRVAPGLKVDLVSTAADFSIRSTGRPTVVDCGPPAGPIDDPGDRAAEAQWRGLSRAVDAVLAGQCDALVTGPVTKKLVSRISPGFVGHTEYLAGRGSLAADDVTMAFVSDRLAVGLVSTHLPLRAVPGAVTRLRLDRTMGHLRDLLERLRGGIPLRIGVAALNPHAGEDGLFGLEERDVIEPFCRSHQGVRALAVEGPLPAETLFREAIRGRYHGVVAMYHDQAMIPLKLPGVGRMVNVTLGLPFIRTSPDHGVAYDIAGKGLADPVGMRLAIELATRLAEMKMTGHGEDNERSMVS